MSVTVGLDTSFVVGLVDDRDHWHRSAKSLYEQLVQVGAEVVIFDCVLVEVVSALARRTHEQHRSTSLPTLLSRLHNLFPVKAAVWLYPDLPTLYDVVIARVEESSGELNFNDALIALACQQRNIAYLASFDADFDRVEWLTRVATGAEIPAEK